MGKIDCISDDLRRKRAADLPMVSERINDTPETPAIFVSHWRYLGCACRDGLCAHRRRVFHNQQHSNRASAKRFGAEVEMLRGFFSDPKLRAGNRQLSEAAALNTVQLVRAERRLVKVDRLRPVSHGQRGGNRRSEAVWFYAMRTVTGFRILRSKKPCDLSIARFSRKMPKWSSIFVARLSKRREPLQKPRNPSNVSELNSIGQVFKLNGQVSTHLPQILDCPACRRSAELTVSDVYFRAPFKQQSHNFAMPIQCRIVKGRGARFVSLVHDLVICVKNDSDIFQIALLYRLN